MPASLAPGQCQYEVLVIEPPPCPPLITIATPAAINDAGDVVGHVNECSIGPDRGFLWTEAGGFQLLDFPPGTESSTPQDLTRNRQIVGYFDPGPASGTRAFLIDQNEFVVIHPPPGGSFSQAFGISEPRQVVGETVNPPTDSAEAFIWEAGKMTILGPFPILWSSAWDVNDAGVVVGDMGSNSPITPTARAFIWQTGEFVVLPPIPGGLTSVLRAINERGVAVGGGLVPNPDGPPLGHALLAQGGEVFDLGTLPGFLQSGASDINDANQVVGFSRNPPSIDRAFLWQKGVMYDLNDLVTTGPEVEVRQARSINNSGQILTQIAFNGSARTAILTPIPASPADLDLDCRTDSDDLMILLSEWGATGSRADYNTDGTVDVIDLLFLLAHWG